MSARSLNWLKFGGLVALAFALGLLFAVFGGLAALGALCAAVWAARLPRYGVTAFCPTTVACAPAALRVASSASAIGSI